MATSREEPIDTLPFQLSLPTARSLRRRGVGRNSFRRPGFFGLDLSFQKSFGLPSIKVLGENARIEARADFFNVFNNLNLTDMSNVIGSNPYLAYSYVRAGAERTG
jgi:hypothetical protein